MDAEAGPAQTVSEASAADVDESRPVSGFMVSTDAYSGPFDVLLGLLANKRLELTEVSLSSITEEFLAYISAMDFERNMDEASSFIDVASILVEAKSVAILPDNGTGERDEQSLEALRERDLLFARLLQYQAFKQAGLDFRDRMEVNAGHLPHPGYVDESIAAMLPELAWTLGPQELARLAARVIMNAPMSEVSVHQLHVPLVDLRQQAALVRHRLRDLKHGEPITFDELTEDAGSRVEVVARFLAVLAFFKQGAVQFRQDGPFDVLYLRWMQGRDDDPSDAEIAVDEADFA